MRYIVIGAGAIGGTVGGALAENGRDVVLVARGRHLEVLRSRGLRLRSWQGDRTIPVTAVGGPAEVRLAVDDVLLVCVKTQQLEDALLPWIDADVYDQHGKAVGTAGERLPVCTALNGVAAEDIASRWFTRVYGVCVWLPAAHLEPGEVFMRGDPIGILRVGRVPVSAASDSDPALLEQIAADLTASGIPTHVVDDVMAWKYNKLISNLGNAPSALIGGHGDPSGVTSAARAEGQAVLARAGIDYVDDETERVARAGFSSHRVPGEPEDAAGSTWQSLRRGTGNVETDYLNGEIVKIAHQHGLTAPVNAALARLMRAAARGRTPAGTMSPDELRGQVGLDVSGDGGRVVGPA